MNHWSKYTLSVAFLLCWVADLKAASSCRPKDQAASKHPYPIVLSGNLPIHGYAVDRFVALSYRNNTWVRVPLQVDERNSHGEYVLSEGLPYTRGSDNQIFDANDELALYGRSLGAFYGGKELLDESIQRWLSRARAYWQINFCGQKNFYGSILLVALKQKAPAYVKQAVTFNMHSRKVFSRYYRYMFDAKKAALLGRIFLKSSQGEVEAIADSSFLMIARLPWFLPNMHFNQDSFKSEIESWQVGPVRAIVAVGVKFNNFLSLFNWHMFSELVFYEGMFQIPTEIHFPFEANSLLKPGSGMAYSLNFWKPDDWQITANMDGLPTRGPEWLAENEGATKKRANYYAQGAHKSGQWAFSAKVRVDKKAAAEFLPPLLMQESDFTDKSKIEAWPWLPKVKGDFGVYLDVSKVKKGVYDFGLDLILRTEAYQKLTDYGSVTAQWRPYP